MKFGTGALRALSLAVIAPLLASCGGQSLVAFNPARIIVFGDEASVIVAGSTPSDGRKYTINAFDTTNNVVNCGSNAIWIQVLALGYNISFPQCQLPADSRVVGQIRALAGAQAGGTGDIDLTAQVTRQLALAPVDGGGITNTDLVTVYAGVNDIIAAFERYKAGASSDAVVADVEAAGETLANQVNRIAAAGGRVIVSTVPDVGVTPYAVSRTVDDAAQLTFLTGRFNARMLVTINNNGRLIGLIELNPYLISVVANPLPYGIANATQAGCLPTDALKCTSQYDSLNPELVLDATSTVPASDPSYLWLWATDLQLSPKGHAQLGNLALSRASNQPF